MEITETIIRAYARKYTLQQLRDLLDDAMKKLNTGSVITVASSGSGTSYTRVITMKPDEAVELFQLCIEYKEGSTVNTVRTTNFTDPGTIC